jgi:hypothetical protein
VVTLKSDAESLKSDTESLKSDSGPPWVCVTSVHFDSPCPGFYRVRLLPRLVPWFLPGTVSVPLSMPLRLIPRRVFDSTRRALVSTGYGVIPPWRNLSLLCFSPFSFAYNLRHPTPRLRAAFSQGTRTQNEYLGLDESELGEMAIEAD